jgi:hypothetical protein
VEGELTLIMGDQPKLVANRFRVDLRTLVSEIADTPLAGPAGVFLAQRDQAVRTLLETGTYPFAEFAATGLERLPARHIDGQTINVGVVGDLTVHGVTRPVLLETEATFKGETLTGMGIAQIRMMDYGVQPPANNGAMDVEDDLTIVVRFVANAAPITGPQVSLDDRHPKLDTPLATLARIARDRGIDEALKTAREMNFEVTDGRVRVVVARGPGQRAPVRALIEAAGGAVYAEEVSATGGWVPISAIEDLADRSEVRALRVPLREE